MKKAKVVNVNIELRKLITQLKDNCLSSGTAEAAPQVSLKNGAPASLETLLPISHDAPLGKGEKTVVDKKWRKTLEVEMSEINVSFPQLDDVVSRIKQDLVTDLSTQKLLRAELYKVLIYRPGDFFRPHFDSKKADNHIITLAVDTGLEQCDGGFTWFRKPRKVDYMDDGEEILAHSESVVWKSRGEPGAWAAW
jgi:hypothetical protein